MFSPDLNTSTHLAKSGNVIPISSTILADTETPVTVWMKLFRKSAYSFLLESVTGDDRVARYSFIGGDPFMVFSASGKSWKVTGLRNESGVGDPIGALRALLAIYKPVPIEGMPRFTGGIVGYLAYDAVRLQENVPDRHAVPGDDGNEILYGFYRDLLVFDNREHRLSVISNILPGEFATVTEAYTEACRRIGAIADRLAVRLGVNPVQIRSVGEISSNFKKADYELAVDKCKEYIKAGDIFQVVLSQRFSVPVDADPFDLYRILRTVNPSPYMFYLNGEETSVIGASPEMLVRAQNGIVETRPLAGTRRRGKDEKDDLQLEKELLADPKERAEHVMLVDLGRNDLGRVCTFGSVSVDNVMHIERFSHVMHIVSDVRGNLKEGCDAFDALLAAFPAGTLSGAPKIRAMEIIDELEPSRRGIYGGALGYVGFDGNLDSCIVIRTMVWKDGVAVIQAGAGIVADSVPALEYEETLNKAGALFSAIRETGRTVGRAG